MIEVSTGGQREDASTRNFTAKDTEASLRDIDHSGVSKSSGPLPAFPEQYMHFPYQECDSLHPSCLAAVLTSGVERSSFSFCHVEVHSLCLTSFPAIHSLL